MVACAQLRAYLPVKKKSHRQAGTPLASPYQAPWLLALAAPPFAAAVLKIKDTPAALLRGVELALARGSASGSRPSAVVPPTSGRSLQLTPSNYYTEQVYCYTRPACWLRFARTPYR